jgi:hypothetical protein
MTFRPISVGQGYPAIGEVVADDAYNDVVPLGTIITAVDPTYGAGEFIFLKGVTSTVVGSVVTYNVAFQSALASIAIGTPSALAIATAATVGSTKGWYQISGLAVLAKAAATSFAAGAALGATSGLAVAAVSGLIVEGAVIAVAASNVSPAKTTVQVMVNRPHAPEAT